MSSLPRSRTPDLSRSKIYLSHLGELLNEHTLQPETVITSKLFPKSRGQSLKIRSKSNQFHSLFKKSAEKRLKEPPLLNYRSQQLPHTSTNHRPRPSLIDLRPKSTIFGNAGPSLQGTTFTFQLTRPAFHHFSNVQMPSKQQPLTTPLPQQQKPFLRKGSNLQRQILASLLRNSSSRRESLESRRYSKEDITKMVQVFKGTSEGIRERKGLSGKAVSGKQVVMSYSSVQRGRRSTPREIAGWEQQSMELVAVQP